RRILRAAEDGLDLLVRILEAGVLVRLVGRLDDHVLRVLVPVLAELAAAHADDGDLVTDGLGVHRGRSLRSAVRRCKGRARTLFRDPERCSTRRRLREGPREQRVDRRLAVGPEKARARAAEAGLPDQGGILGAPSLAGPAEPSIALLVEDVERLVQDLRVLASHTRAT